ncbi:MAG: ABC transporter ATP-binding protein [Chloroflexota bacterium]
MTEGSAGGTVGAAGGTQGSPGGAVAIAVDRLTKRYGDRVVLDGISFAVRPGELVALVGPNGAGKTTTVEIIEGYRQADDGRVEVLGIDPARGGRPLRARVGLMLQDGGIDMRARPRETIVQYGRFHADPRDADELVDLVGLRAVERTRYRRLSGGERQRLGLALALVGRPEVVILDEPTSGMDPEARAVTRTIVSDLRASGMAILLTSHDLTEVERLADRIVIVDEGRVVATGSPAEIVAAAKPMLRFRLDGPATDLAEKRLEADLRGLHPEASVATDAAGRYRIDGIAPDPAVVSAVAAWAAANGSLIIELRASGGSLEDAYLDLVAHGRDVA